MTHLSLRLALSALLLCACAGNNGTGDGSTDSRDGGQDERDAGRRRDGGGSTTCPVGQHRCGGGCIDDLENLPENGCRFGCGEPCPTPAGGEAACDEAGACTIACPPPFHRQGTECVCTPNTCDAIGYTCGAPDDGCGAPLDCGACDGDGVCTDGTCRCPEDAREPNDSFTAVDAQTVLASLADDDDRTVTYEDFTLNDDRDEDFFRFAVADNTEITCPGCNPQLRVTLDRIPAGSNYDLAAYYVCSDSSAHETSCTSGSTTNDRGRGCQSRSSGTTSETVELATNCGGTTDESGILYVRVWSATWAGSCAPYRLRITVE